MDEQRCINCGFNVSSVVRHTLELDNIRRLIQQWVAPRQVSSDSLICQTCWNAANEDIDTPSQDSERTAGHAVVCINCDSSLRRTRKHFLRDDTQRELLIKNTIAEWIFPRMILSTSAICHPCWQRADRAALRAQQPTTSSTQVTQIYLPNYKRAASSGRQCLFSHCMETDRRRIPEPIRVRLFCDYSFYIPVHCRFCSYHLENNMWEQLINECDNHMFSAEHIEDYTSFLKQRMTHNIDFEDMENTDDHLVKYWLGLSKQQFRQLLEEVPRLRSSHRGLTGLAAYLIKLRTGDSDERLSTLFNIPRSTLERLMKNARQMLQEDFVPEHLGLDHMTRADIAARNLTIPNGLFGSDDHSKPIVIMDGTYIYIQKSSNYQYQKQTYSLHKFKNLVKPFLIVCCDGYILDVLGPYPATTSDADILKNEFDEEDKPLRRYFNRGDVFILDRGFRDSLPLLEQCGYSPHMPSFLEEGESQLSTIKANQSRKVTICRWVVEIVNGIFKQAFKLFRQDYFNRATPHLMEDFEIAAALINRFHTKVTDRNDAHQILQIINEKMYVNNSFADYVLTNNLNRRRTQFVNISVNADNLRDFPRLTLEELILIACGTYQIKQARSYYGEHIRNDGSYIIEVCREVIANLPVELPQNSWILRARIQSRHISRKIYYVYILINASLVGRNSIEFYYCNCIVGKRTVGCCAHTMTVLWYLGWARFEENIARPAPFLDDLLIIYENIDEE